MIALGRKKFLFVGHAAARENLASLYALVATCEANDVNLDKGNIQRFGPHALHNTENVIAIDEGIHRQISACQSFQAQREFGLKNLRDYGVFP
jgi:hypothetical protein